MATLRDEMLTSYYLYESDADLEIVRGDDGETLLRRVPDPAAEAAALGPGAYRDPYALSEAAGAPITEEEVAGTMAGIVPGGAIGMATGIQDIGALGYGGYKAATAEEGQRIDEFLKGFSAISGVIGSERAFELYNAGVDMLPVSDEAKQGLKQGAMVGEVLGLGKAGEAVVGGAKAYAAGAPARIAERQGSVTLGMGVDPMPMIDEAIVAGQKLMGNVDEARAAYEASPNDPALKQQYLDLRRQRDAQLSQMSPSKQLELDVDYRMDHQPRGPQDGGGRLDDITAGGELFPEDVYSADGLRLYGNPNNAFDRESHAAIMAARGNPDAEITIYRAVPQNIDQINPGDWVTLSPEYAAVHAASGYGPDGQQAGKVISQRVRVKDVYSDGNDLNEFGFFPSELADAGVKKIVPPTETEPGIIAFHGSGADFDEFRLEMIGTGEGAQAYGYGLYFTDSEDIARFYRDTVSTGKTRIPYGSSEDAAQAVPDNVPYLDVDGYRSYSMGDAEEVLDSVLTKQYAGDNPGQEIIDFNLQILKKAGVLNAEMPDGSFVTMLVDQSGGQFTVTPVKQQTGKIYKVGLSPKPDELLDYDGPQTDAIKAKVLQALEGKFEPIKLPSGEYGIRYFDEKVGAERTVINVTFGTRKGAERLLNATGEEILKIVEKIAGGSKQGAAFLSDAGIPGIKYRAAGSRGPSVADAAAERNYVIFDENAIKILEKYGIVGPVAITAVAAGQNADSDEGEVM